MASAPRPSAQRSWAVGIALTPECRRCLENRPYPPGRHRRSRKTTSDYEVRLLESERLRAQHDMSEKALGRACVTASKSGGRTEEALVVAPESRLDATVLRAGSARTVYQDR